jgi:hypothetical protein
MRESTFQVSGQPRRRDGSKALVGGLILFAVIDGIILATVMLAAGVPIATVALVLLPIILSAPLLILLVVRLAWPPWAREFPAQSPREDAVVQILQSFSFGGLRRFNNVLTITADEDYLHVALPRVLQWPGCRPMSIPWSEITDARRTSQRDWISARAAGRRIAGPAWCMSLALVDDSPGE